MDQEKQREIASKGGRAAHQKGTAHCFTPEEARAAGRKGGQAAHIKGTAHEFTAEEARVAGRKGGQAARHGGNPQLANANRQDGGGGRVMQEPLTAPSQAEHPTAEIQSGQNACAVNAGHPSERQESLQGAQP